MNPEIFSFPMYPTAAARPIVARLPLSQYVNGLIDLPFNLARIDLAAYCPI